MNVLSWNEIGKSGLEISREILKFVIERLRRPHNQLENRSFHVVDRTRTAMKCTKMKDARARRVKLLFFVVTHAHLQFFVASDV